MAFKFRAYHVRFVTGINLSLSSSSRLRILITVCKVGNDITTKHLRKLQTDSGVKGFFKIVSRKVRTMTAYCLNSCGGAQ